METVITGVVSRDQDLLIDFSAALERVTVGTDFVWTGDGMMAVSSAGALDDGPGVLRFEGLNDGLGFGLCLAPRQERVLLTDGRASAVGLDVDGTLVVQSAAPLTMARAEDLGVILEEPTYHTSGIQNLFHADAGTGVACASCHPEGLDDGRVWTFFEDPTEPLFRRTMPLAGRILSRQPYHWDAAHSTADALMDDTFIRRMGGAELDPGATTDLFEWLDGLRHVRAHPAAPEVDIAIGRAAFATAGCAECHAGDAFTNNTIEPIGRSVEAVKTPSLLGVGLRESLLHDGCADDLDDRFGSAGGGDHSFPCDANDTPPDSHGRVSALTEHEIEALKAYLRTL